MRIICEPCTSHPFKPNQRTLSISEIVRKSCDFIGVSVENIQSKNRDLYLVDARRLLA
jgi:chromosomal replication initiation ATPase DnaA